MRNDKRLHTVLAVLPLGWLLAACAGHTVDLGGGDGDAPGTGGEVCGSSGSATGEFYVLDQSGLEALRGCREIHGSVRVGLFDADFTALDELQRVDGALELGISDDFSYLDDPRFDGIALGERPVPTAFADLKPYRSLAGLESLEFVGQLTIDRLGEPSLESLTGLQTVAGDLKITNCPALRDLSGLEQLHGVGGLVLEWNPELVSLDGLVLPEPWGAQRITLYDLPKLANIDALSELQFSGEGLNLSVTALENLGALSQLEGGDSISLSGNPALVDISALDNLGGTSFLWITSNDALRRVPEFRALVSLEQLTIAANAALEVCDLAMPTYWHYSALGLHELYEIPVELIQVKDNPKLVRFALSRQLKWTNHIFVTGNDSLRELDLGGAVDLDVLSIKDNQRLDTIVARDLKTIRELGVKRNPQLSMGSFAGVKTAITDARDNAP